MQALLKQGAAVDIKDKSGSSALMHASKSMRAGCVTALLTAGADRSQLPAAAAAAAAATATAAAAPTGPGGWLYLDPSGAQQGPFTITEMRRWYQDGFLSPTLLVKQERSGFEGWVASRGR